MKTNLKELVDEYLKACEKIMWEDIKALENILGKIEEDYIIRKFSYDAAGKSFHVYIKDYKVVIYLKSRENSFILNKNLTKVCTGSHDLICSTITKMLRETVKEQQD